MKIPTKSDKCVVSYIVSDAQRDEMVVVISQIIIVGEIVPVCVNERKNVLAVCLFVGD